MAGRSGSPISSTTADWNTAAERRGNAILAANPDVLLVVEGVSTVGSDTYWWGGNLSGARTAPIQLSHPERLVYSAHEYGPEVHEQTWFDDATFPASLAPVWDKHFDFIMAATTRGATGAGIPTRATPVASWTMTG